jgi:mRNA-degrading endonuclease RelE of RelBE toxin-antitoxin system
MRMSVSNPDCLFPSFNTREDIKKLPMEIRELLRKTLVEEGQRLEGVIKHRMLLLDPGKLNRRSEYE